MKTIILLCSIICLVALHMACSRNDEKEEKKALEDIVETKEKDSSGETVHRSVIKAKKEHLGDYLKLLDSRNRKVRLKAIILLGDLDECDEAQEALIKVVESGSYAERCNAVGYLRTKRTLPVLIKALKDDHWTVRSNASQSLGCIRDKRVIGPLKTALADKVIAVRISAAKALYKLEDGSGLPVIEKAIDDSDEEVSRRARMAACEIDYLMRCRKGQDRDVEIAEVIPPQKAKSIIREAQAK